MVGMLSHQVGADGGGFDKLRVSGIGSTMPFDQTNPSSLRAQQSNPGPRCTALDCFAALAMTRQRKSQSLESML
jgi:hypothetical protein